jgi:hypothetical protein
MNNIQITHKRTIDDNIKCIIILQTSNQIMVSNIHTSQWFWYLEYKMIYQNTNTYDRLVIGDVLVL